MLVDSENRKEQNMNDWQDVERELSTEMLNAIRQGMQEKGISLTILADMSGVSLETVERLESGRLDVKLDEAMRVLHVLGLTLKVMPL
jgi:DNA-binding helix-turn-helix protein